jgi:hypothetical protein
VHPILGHIFSSLSVSTALRHTYACVECFFFFNIGVLGFDSRRGLGIFLFTTASRKFLEPTQPPIQWVPEVLSLGVKRPGRKANHSPSSSGEVKELAELYFTLAIRLHGVVLSYKKKHRDNFTFTVTFPNLFRVQCLVNLEQSHKYYILKIRRTVFSLQGSCPSA